MKEFENEYAKVFYDESLGAISLVFKKKASESDFIHVNGKLLEVFLHLSTHKFIVDARQMGVVGLEGQKWVVENLFPGMLKHLGGKTMYHVQILPNTDVFAKMAGSNIKTKASSQKDKSLVIESFYSEGEAREWLTKQP